MNSTELKNYIYERLNKGFPFKPSTIDYVTQEESIYISGMLSAREQIFNIIDEYFNKQ